MATAQIHSRTGSETRRNWIARNIAKVEDAMNLNGVGGIGLEQFQRSEDESPVSVDEDAIYGNRHSTKLQRHRVGADFLDRLVELHYNPGVPHVAEAETSVAVPRRNGAKTFDPIRPPLGAVGRSRGIEEPYRIWQ